MRLFRLAVRRRMSDTNSDTHVSATIKREIPLWGIFMLCGTLAGGAVTMYVGQQRTADRVDSLTISVKEYGAKLDVYSEKNSKNTSDVQKLEYKLETLTQRLADVERMQRGNRP